ncbi:MAG: hypothetical protein ACHQIK_21695 [Candidatus Acidiferrales bacterium]
MPSPSPKALLRIFVNFCLVGWGAAAIYQVSHVGPGYDRLGWVHELTVFFFFALLAFVLLLAEYHLVQRLTRRELNPALGYVQSLGCFLLLLSGIASIYYSRATPLAHHDSAFTDRILQFILVFGHIVFLGNVLWTYVHEGGAP